MKGCIIEERGNGDFVLVTEVVETERMWFSLLMGFGSMVKVLEPQEIIDMIKEKTAEIQNLYQD